MEQELLSLPLVASETIKVYKTASYTLKANRAYQQRQKEANKEEFLAKKSEYMRAYRLKQKLKKQDLEKQDLENPARKSAARKSAARKDSEKQDLGQESQAPA